ncbi:hypothetical protein M501DRAFT_985772 [Patellaria atrata CBS 101060]|uniref:F-box domain-containing protein n=1 Tax=Patellaria atrata CBS 101060 TaxID=1346257 RepID=A0A9P4VS68_9PEZI|nr:hypothetical protein M501DRAFT_985772 [Patellaria atrata CBS 101060]
MLNNKSSARYRISSHVSKGVFKGKQAQGSDLELRTDSDFEYEDHMRIEDVPNGPFLNLPDELHLKIISYLDPLSKAELKRVSCHFRGFKELAVIPSPFHYFTLDTPEQEKRFLGILYQRKGVPSINHPCHNCEKFLPPSEFTEKASKCFKRKLARIRCITCALRSGMDYSESNSYVCSLTQCGGGLGGMVIKVGGRKPGEEAKRVYGCTICKTAQDKAGCRGCMGCVNCVNCVTLADVVQGLDQEFGGFFTFIESCKRVMKEFPRGCSGDHVRKLARLPCQLYDLEVLEYHIHGKKIATEVVTGE